MIKSSSRKLAIKNLKGSDEKLRISWMLKNMKQNKTFYYMSQKENSSHDALLLYLKKKYKNYREQWRNNP